MFKLYNMIIYSGIATFFFLFLTAVNGMFRLGFAMHKTLAMLTIIFALIHAGLQIYKAIKIKMMKK
jgi:hypothetical protein